MRQIVLDTETTGLDPKSGHKIVEIGCIEIFKKIQTGKVFHFYINPERDMPNPAFKVHGLSEAFLKEKPIFRDIAGDFLEFVGDSELVIHNASFDMKFINYELELINKAPLCKNGIVDTLLLARRRFPGSPANLNALCKRFGISLQKREKSGHGALLDSELLYHVYVRLTEGVQSELIEKRKKTSDSLKEKSLESVDKNKQCIDSREFIYVGDFLEHDKLIDKIPGSLWKK